MARAASHIKNILVYADWIGMPKPMVAPSLIGTLNAEQIRGKEVFSFGYDKAWLNSKPAFLLDPDLLLYSGPQYTREEKGNFEIFTDSAPDRWGRVLMERKEGLLAREEGRKPRALMESDFLLGVFDGSRMGGIRLKLEEAGAFLDNQGETAIPPYSKIRTLEEASFKLEEPGSLDDPAIAKWLKVLFAPGSSLGGARPKASVTGPDGDLWIAKFPSRDDRWDTGGWEMVVNELAMQSGINISKAFAKKYNLKTYHTFLTRRFDRDNMGRRIHFASAMTMLGKMDGASAKEGVSYLNIAEFLVRHGAQPDQDLEELWRRIVFNIAVSNSDDHLRNHGFLLKSKGWTLSPAYDMNPTPNSAGLTLNISETSNALDLDLAQEVAPQFRISDSRRKEIISQIIKAVNSWPKTADKYKISHSDKERMESAFIKMKTK
jgi:serine/threonine-protein kinase HipA